MASDSVQRIKEKLSIIDVISPYVELHKAGKSYKGRSPFTSADRFHLHFRLLDAGLSIRQSVALILCLVALFGVSTLYVSGLQKLQVLGTLLVVMMLLVWWVMQRIAARRGQESRP